MFSAKKTINYSVGAEPQEGYDISTLDFDYYPYDIQFSGKIQTIDFNDAGKIDTYWHCLNNPNLSKLFLGNTTTLHSYSISDPSEFVDLTFDGVGMKFTPFSSVYSSDFSSDGTKLFCQVDDREIIFKYNLSTPYDITTAIIAPSKKYINGSYASNSIVSNLSTVGAVHEIDVCNTGSNVYIHNSSHISQITLATPYNLLSVTNETIRKVHPSFSGVEGFQFSQYGNVLFVCQTSDETIRRFGLSTPWDIKTIYPLRNPYDPRAYKYTSNTVILTGTNLTSLQFDNTGSNVYVVDLSSDVLTKYTLSSPYNVSTASSANTKTFNEVSMSPYSIRFNDTGTSLYVVDQTTDGIFQYDLSVPYDATTGSIGVGVITDVSTALFQKTKVIDTLSSSGMFISPDGTNMYVSDSSFVWQYSLSTPFDPSSATYVRNQDFTTPFINVGGIVGISFSNDGSKIFLSKVGIVYEVGLATPWDISTRQPEFSNISTTSISALSQVSVVSENTSTTGVTFSHNGNHMYVCSTTVIYQYNLSTPYLASSATYASKSFTPGISGESSIQDICISSNGSKMYVLGASLDRVYELNLSTAYDITTASYNSVNFSVSSQETSPLGLFVRADGNKFYVTGGIQDDVFQYSMTNGDLSTASYDNKSIAIPTETTPTGVAFTPDGTKMFVIGSGSDLVRQATLSTAWDVSSATFSGTIGTIDTTPSGIDIVEGGNLYFIGSSTDLVRQYCSVKNVIVPSSTDICFSNTGNVLYVVQSATDGVYRFNLSSNYDLDTATNSETFLGVNAVEAAPTGISISNDGKRLFLAGSGSDVIRQYNLGTSFDLTTAILTSNLNIAAKETALTSMHLSSNEKYVYIVGTSSDAVHSYATLNGFNFSSLTGITPYNMEFYNNGSNFLLAASGNIINFALNTPYEISTAYHDGKFYTHAAGTAINSVKFIDDGKKVLGTYASGSSPYGRIWAGNCSIAYDISTLSADFTSNILTLDDSDTAPRDFQFGYGGNSIFVLEGADESIKEYESIDSLYLDPIPGSDLNFRDPSAVRLSPTGDKIYLTNASNMLIQLSVSKNFTFEGVQVEANVIANNVLNESLDFLDDGNVLVIANAGDDNFQQFALSVPYDVSTAVRETGYRFELSNANFKDQNNNILSNPYSFRNFNNTSFLTNVSASNIIYEFKMIENLPTDNQNFRDLALKTDGSKIALMNTINGIAECTLAENYNLESGTFNTAYKVTTSNYGNMFDYSPSQNVFYLYSAGLDFLYSANTPEPFDTSNLVITGSAKTDDTHAAGSIVFNSDGTKFLLTSFTLNTNFQVHTTHKMFDFQADSSSLIGDIYFISDNMFVLSNSSDYKLYKYSLSGGDVTTMVQTQSLNVDSLISTGLTTEFLHVSPDGTKIYVSVAGLTDRIYQLDLSTAFDLSTASYNSKSLYTGGQTSTVRGFDISADGSKVYCVNSSNGDIFQYNLSTNFDISSGTYSTVFSTGLTGEAPFNVRLSPSGLKMFYVRSGSIYQYTLTTAYDITSAVYDEVFYSTAKTTYSSGGSTLTYYNRGFTFNNDGTIFYIGDTSGSDRIGQFKVY